MNKSYIELLDKDYGTNVAFIVGAGPSLYEISKNSLFYNLKKYGIVICVNSAICAYKEPNFFISNDHLIVRWDYWKTILDSKCIKIVRNSWLKYEDEIEGFYIFEPRSTPEYIVDFNEKSKMCYCSSSVSALDFLIQCDSVSRIFLLGIDQCKDIETNTKRYYWEYYDKENQPRQNILAIPSFEKQSEVFVYNNMAYRALKKFAKYKNVEIYNCNENSKVEEFQKIKFKEIEKYL